MRVPTGTQLTAIPLLQLPKLGFDKLIRAGASSNGICDRSRHCLSHFPGEQKALLLNELYD